MRIEIEHDFDIPLDALELAVVSPELLGKIAPKIARVERFEQREHCIASGILSRTWFFRMAIPIPELVKEAIVGDRFSWEQSTRYDLEHHDATWTIAISSGTRLRKYIEARGRYELLPTGEEKTTRRVSGEISVHLPLVGKVVESAVLAEIRKSFDAEAETLRELSTLA